MPANPNLSPIPMVCTLLVSVLVRFLRSLVGLPKTDLLLLYLGVLDYVFALTLSCAPSPISFPVVCLVLMISLGWYQHAGSTRENQKVNSKRGRRWRWRQSQISSVDSAAVIVFSIYNPTAAVLCRVGNLRCRRRSSGGAISGSEAASVSAIDGSNVISFGSCC